MVLNVLAKKGLFPSLKGDPKHTGSLNYGHFGDRNPKLPVKRVLWKGARAIVKTSSARMFMGNFKVGVTLNPKCSKWIANTLTCRAMHLDTAQPLNLEPLNSQPSTLTLYFSNARQPYTPCKPCKPYTEPPSTLLQEGRRSSAGSGRD